MESLQPWQPPFRSGLFPAAWERARAPGEHVGGKQLPQALLAALALAAVPRARQGAEEHAQPLIIISY